MAHNIPPIPAERKWHESPYFPATIIPERDDLGRISYAIRYVDGRIVHRGYRTEHAAQRLLVALMAQAKHKP